METLNGILQYVDLETGFWTIVTEEGDNFPLNFRDTETDPATINQLALENTSVELTGTFEESFGFTMQSDKTFFVKTIT